MSNKLIIVDDFPVFREGLKALLSGLPDLEVIGEAGNGELAVEQAAQLKPDLVLINLTIPETNGTEAIRLIKQSHPQIKVIALAAQRSHHALQAALAAGADGYLLKEDTLINLLSAIRRVLDGHVYLATGSAYKPLTGHPGYYVSVKRRRLLLPNRVPCQQNKTH